MKEGKKFDLGKTRLELIPTELIDGVGKVLTFGANKYEADNWRNFRKEDHRRLVGAIMRHLEAYRSGEYHDPESGLPHLAHIATNCGFLLALDKPVDTSKYAGSVAEEHEYVDMSNNEYWLAIDRLAEMFLVDYPRGEYILAYIPTGGKKVAEDLASQINRFDPYGYVVVNPLPVSDVEPGEGVILVDDIVDTGKTLSKYEHNKVYTLVKRYSAKFENKAVSYAILADHDKYIRFPWEHISG